MAVTYIVKTSAGETDLAAAGGHGLVVARRKGSVSSASWVCDAAFDSAPVWPYGTAVTILRRGWSGEETLFKGIITEAYGDGAGAAETVRYVASDAWWHFEREIYRSARKIMLADGTLAAASWPRALLCQSESGTRLSAAQMCAGVCGFAASIGIPVQGGSISAPVIPPWDEITDKTIAEIINRVLRWQPDASVWIDYSTTPPTLNVMRRSTAPAASIALSALETCRVRSYPELQLPGCVVTFELANARGRTIEEQTAGDPSALGCARMTIALDFEGSAQGPVQEIKTVALGDHTQLSWWQQMFPWLPNDAVLDGVMVTPAPPEGFTNILVSGQVTQWMQDELNLDAGNFTFECTAEFTRDGQTYSSKDLSRTFTLTNASSKRYIGRASFGWHEDAPTGLAAAFYSAMNTLQYGGEISLIEEECTAGRSLIGKVLNISGGPAAWASMAADVVEVTEDFDMGHTTIKLGPQSALTPQDMIDLIRCSRWRVKWSPLSATDGGASQTDETVVDPFSPESDTSDAPGQLSGLNIVYEEES